MGAGWGAYGLCVFIVLTFTQCWVMPLTGPDGDADASTLIRSLYIPAYAGTLALTVMRARQVLASAIRAPLLWATIGLAFVSTIWSVDPGVSFRRSVALLFLTLAGVVLASNYRWPKLLEVLSTSFAIVVLLCFVFCLLLPRYGRMTTLFPGAWRGVWFEKNALGDNMAVACVTFCAAARLNAKRAWFWLIMTVLAVALLLLSRSKTSLVSFVLGCAALAFVVLVKRGPVTGVLTTFLSVTAMLVLAAVVYFHTDAVFALLGKDATLTGRTSLWDAVLVQIHRRPMLGFGYGAVWENKDVWAPLAQISKRAKFVAAHAHNSWLEVWLALGLVGLILFSVYFMETWVRTIVAAYSGAGGYFALPFLLIFSLMTLTENVALVYNNGFFWVLFVVLAVKLAGGEGPNASAENRS